MKLNRMHGALVVAGTAFALYVLSDEPTTQDKATPTSARSKLGSRGSLGAPPQLAGQATDYMQPCDTVSPFGSTGTPCIPAPQPSPGDSSQAGGGADTMNVPDFVNVQVINGAGGGIIGKLLKSAGRAITGTPQNNDSTLIEVTAAEDGSAATSIQEALDSGKYLIVEGPDSIEGSTRLGQIMLERKLLSIQGVTAYGVIKGAEGAVYVTPLLSVADKNGVRRVDQIHGVLGINKT